MSDHEHVWGPIEYAHFTGEPHRKCQVETEAANGVFRCRWISLDLEEDE